MSEGREIRELRMKKESSQHYVKKHRRAQPEMVKDVLMVALRRNGLDKDIARYEFVRLWPSIVGEEIAKRAVPEVLRGKTLIVKVSDPIWAQELSFQKQVLLSRLNKAMSGHGFVHDIRFVC